MQIKRIFLLAALFLVALLEIRQLFHSSSLRLNKQIEVTPEATTTAVIITGEIATVAFAIDGDTVELTDGRRVRYIGIDAPETAHEGKSAECFGNEARVENSKRTNGKKVRLEKDISETDGYGRLLRYVYADQPARAGAPLINEQLVKDGFARAWNVPPDEKYKDALLVLQQEAREARRGLWELCRSR